MGAPVEFEGSLAAMMAGSGYEELVDDEASDGGPYAGVVCVAVSAADDTVTFTATMTKGDAITATLLSAGESLPGPFNVVTKTAGSGKLLLVLP